jgi:periplasmic protein TonB
MGIAGYFRGSTDRSRFLLCGLSAVVLHAVVFLAGGFALATRVEYGMAGAAAQSRQTPSLTTPVEDMVVLEDETSDLPTVKKRIHKPIPTPVTSPAAGGSTSGGAREMPSYYENPPPPYPEEARRLHQEGLVVLQVQVDTQGNVASAVLRNSSGYPLLDGSAVETVKNWKFKPARMAGIAVSTSVEIPVRFKLQDMVR